MLGGESFRRRILLPVLLTFHFSFLSRAGRQADYGHSRQMPNYDPVNDLFGIIMAKRNRPSIEYRV
jgi:hypothetical protein